MVSAARGARLRSDRPGRYARAGRRTGRSGSGIANNLGQGRGGAGRRGHPSCCGAGDTIVVAESTPGAAVVWRWTLGGSLQAGERWRAACCSSRTAAKRLVPGPHGSHGYPAGGSVRRSFQEIRSGNAPDGRVNAELEPGAGRLTGQVPRLHVQASALPVDLRTFGVSRTHSRRAARARPTPLWARHARGSGSALPRFAVTGVRRYSSGDGSGRGLVVDTPLACEQHRTRTTYAPASSHCSYSSFLDQWESGVDSPGPPTHVRHGNAPLREGSDLGRADHRPPWWEDRREVLIEARTGRRAAPALSYCSRARPVVLRCSSLAGTNRVAGPCPDSPGTPRDTLGVAPRRSRYVRCRRWRFSLETD